MKRKLISPLFLIAALFSSTGQADSLKGYWHYDEFLAEFPEQRPISELFAQTVRDKPSALTVAQEQPVIISVVYPGQQISDYWFATSKRLKSEWMLWGFAIKSIRCLLARILILASRVFP